jgi:hypothetical protein
MLSKFEYDKTETREDDGGTGGLAGRRRRMSFICQVEKTNSFSCMPLGVRELATERC